MSELQDKKRALIAEAEVYRQTLKLELHNLKLFAAQTKRKFTRGSTPNPWLLLGAAGSLFGKRRFSWWRIMTSAFLSWQLYSKFLPFWRNVFGRRYLVPAELESDDSE